MALDAKNIITIHVSDPLNTPVAHAVQEDTRSRYVEITLVRNGEPLDIPAGTLGMVGIRRPNDTYVLYDETEDEAAAVTFTNNVATVWLTQEALAVPGRLYCSVSLYTSTVRLTAFHFMIDVEPTAVPSGVVIESDYFNILQAQIENLLNSQSDWDEDDPTALSYIKNKPNIVGAVQSDWDENDPTDPAYIKNKPNIVGGAQADWDEADPSDPSYIKNKPTIPAAPVQSNWNETNTSSLAYIQNKPTIPASPVQSDWNEADNTSLAYIANKPTIPAAQIQSDWNQSTTTSLDYIKNKPTSMTPTAHASTHATGGTDAITPADIGAATTSHHSTHATGGSDALSASDIGAAAATHASTHEIGGTDAISAASTTKAGLVQLYDGVDSQSTTLAATANAVRLAYNHGGGSGATLLQVTASAVSSLPTTINDANITANMVVVQCTLSAPQTQSGDWTVTTSAGSLTISGNMASISTDIELILAEV